MYSENAFSIDGSCRKVVLFRGSRAWILKKLVSLFVIRKQYVVYKVHNTNQYVLLIDAPVQVSREHKNRIVLIICHYICIFDILSNL